MKYHMLIAGGTYAMLAAVMFARQPSPASTGDTDGTGTPAAGDVVPGSDLSPAVAAVSPSPVATNDKVTIAATATNGEEKPAVFSALRDDVPMPEKIKKPREGVTKYPFETMGVNQSFGVPGKTLKNINSTVSSANRRQPQIGALDANGKAVMVEIDDPVNAGQKMQVQKKVPAKQFVALEVDPKTDRDGCAVRIWRTV